jgi:3-oxoacyl-[acyl-carrier protein] reductase
MNTYDFKGQTAVVTGGAQGIGYAVVQRLLLGGAKVALWDQSADALQSAKASLGGHGEVATFQVDITDLKQVEAAADATGRTLGSISVLVNSAGIAGANAPVASYAPDEWQKVISVNLTGTFNVNRAVIGGMVARNYGRIVNVASIAGKEGNPNASAYSASKAGVIALTKSLGKEVAGHDVAVNAITPDPSTRHTVALSSHGRTVYLIQAQIDSEGVFRWSSLVLVGLIALAVAQKIRQRRRVRKDDAYPEGMLGRRRKIPLATAANRRSHETSHWHRRHLLHGPRCSITAGLVQAALGNRCPSLGRSRLPLDRRRGQAGCRHNCLVHRSARR